MSARFKRWVGREGGGQATPVVYEHLQILCIASLRTFITMSNNANQSTDSKKQVADSDGVFAFLICSRRWRTNGYEQLRLSSPRPAHSTTGRAALQRRNRRRRARGRSSTTPPPPSPRRREKKDGARRLPRAPLWAAEPGSCVRVARIFFESGHVLTPVSDSLYNKPHHRQCCFCFLFVHSTVVYLSAPIKIGRDRAHRA